MPAAALLAPRLGLLGCAPLTRGARPYLALYPALYPTLYPTLIPTLIPTWLPSEVLALSSLAAASRRTSNHTSQLSRALPRRGSQHAQGEGWQAERAPAERREARSKEREAALAAERRPASSSGPPSLGMLHSSSVGAALLAPTRRPKLRKAVLDRTDWESRHRIAREATSEAARHAAWRED